MKGSAITGPVGKEAAELWPVSVSESGPLSAASANHAAAYCQQLRCRDVRGLLGKEYEQRDKQHVGVWTRVP